MLIIFNVCYQLFTIIQQSWVDKMITRLRNVVKRDKLKRPSSSAEVPHAKRKKSKEQKAKEQLLRRYPVGIEVIVEDSDVHKKAITDELAKSKPRDTVLLPLFKSTYHERRLFIQNEATSAQQIKEKYPGLCLRPIVYSYTLL